MRIDNSLVDAGDWASASGKRGLYQLLEQRPDIDAVFVSNDQMAVGVLQAARQLGVVGFDNIPESTYFYPPLTTVAQVMIELGSRAVEVLCRLIDANESSQKDTHKIDLIQPLLIVRASSARNG
jgi:DNA-binding LacI/PurR family transcriptional regulator